MTLISTDTVTLSDKICDTFDHWIESGVRRIWLAWDDGKLRYSHPAVKTTAQQVARLDDWNNHEGVFIELNRDLGVMFAAFVHSTTRGQAQGGVRLLDYEHYGSLENLIVDGLRLACGMSEKNASAEIWWGGGKGIICPVHHVVNDYQATKSSEYPTNREELFKAYGRFIASLGGIYITAEDMNTTPQDMRMIHSECRFVTCLPPEMGGSSNPSRYTAQGVFVSMLAGLRHLDGPSQNPLQNKTVLLQGVGNVGRPLLDMIVRAGGNVTVFDPNPVACEEALAEHGTNSVTIFEDVSSNGFEQFIELKGDVFSPNAIGAIITAERIQRMQVRMIAGAANNQLKTRNLADTLQQSNVLYLPDFLINCMGIVNCANEQYGYAESKISTEIDHLQLRVEQLLNRSTDQLSLYDLAIEQAQKLMKQRHPIWPENGRHLISSLIQSNWASPEITN